MGQRHVQDVYRFSIFRPLDKQIAYLTLEAIEAELRVQRRNRYGCSE
jgi:hypothetical protein